MAGGKSAEKPLVDRFSQTATEKREQVRTRAHTRSHVRSHTQTQTAYMVALRGRVLFLEKDTLGVRTRCLAE